MQPLQLLVPTLYGIALSDCNQKPLLLNLSKSKENIFNEFGKPYQPLIKDWKIAELYLEETNNHSNPRYSTMFIFLVVNIDYDFNNPITSNIIIKDLGFLPALTFRLTKKNF